MSEILGWFVHQPLRLAALASPFLVLWLLLRGLGTTWSGRRRVLVYPIAFFLAFAAWEWLVMTRTPEADIRVDLLFIWPAGLIVILWTLARLLRR